MTVTSGELELIRKAQESTFDQSAEVWRASRSRTSTGGTTESYSKQSSNDCRMAPAKPPAEFIAAGRLSGGLTWWVTFAHGTDVQPGDEVRIGGRTLKVVGTESGKSNLTALRALCEEAR